MKLNSTISIELCVKALNLLLFTLAHTFSSPMSTVKCCKHPLSNHTSHPPTIRPLLLPTPTMSSARLVGQSAANSQTKRSVFIVLSRISCVCVLLRRCVCTFLGLGLYAYIWLLCACVYNLSVRVRTENSHIWWT